MLLLYSQPSILISRTICLTCCNVRLQAILNVRRLGATTGFEFSFVVDRKVRPKVMSGEAQIYSQPLIACDHLVVAEDGICPLRMEG